MTRHAEDNQETRAGAAPASRLEGLRRRVARVDVPEFPSNGAEDGSEPLERGLDRAMMKLTGAGAARAAWTQLFSPEDVVGIKVNCHAGPLLCTRPSVAKAIAACLERAGLRPGRIIIWDRANASLEACGYRLRIDPEAVRCFGVEDVFDSRLISSGDLGGLFSLIVTELCTALISAPVLKDHSLAGLDGCMRNFSAAMHNPQKYYANGNSPFIADLMNAAPIRAKWRLGVCDALSAQADGGPGLNSEALWAEGALLVSADPVALDAAGLSLIERRRAATGLPTLESEGREPQWLEVAERLGLGSRDVMWL
jgi:uncharacterized protein (DUF362 family)